MACTLEIAKYSVNEEYIKDPQSAFAKGVDVGLNAVNEKGEKIPRPGVHYVYHGSAIEEDNKSDGYLLIGWDSVDAHHAFEKSADYPKMISAVGSVKAANSGPIDLVHVELRGSEPFADALVALKAPVTEIVSFVLAPSTKLEDDFAPLADELVSIKRPGLYKAVWGSVVERPGTICYIFGWESVEAHQAMRDATDEATVSLRTRLRASISTQHTPVVRHVRFNGGHV